MLETDGSGNVTAKYIRGINLIAFDNQNSVRKFYLFNAHGDVVQLTDSTGNVVKDYSYDAFGNRKLPKYGDVDGDGSVTSTDAAYIQRKILDMITEFPIKDGFIAGDVDGDGIISSTDKALVDRFVNNMIAYFPADINCDDFAQENEVNAVYNDDNVFRYCGEYFDKETGTIYLRARYYNPVVGRFITEDTNWGKDADPMSLNLYTYCWNNPVLYVDMSGNGPIFSFLVHAGEWLVDKIPGVNTAATGAKLLMMDKDAKGIVSNCNWRVICMRTISKYT